MPHLSSAVQTAQIELHKKRATLSLKRVCNDPDATQRETAVFKLPPHLGWETDAFSSHIRKNQDTQPKQTPTHVETLHQPTVQKTAPPNIPNRVKHYPSIGIQAIHQKQVPHYQVWLSCRLLDVQGQGWLTLKEIRFQLTDGDSPLRLFGWRRLRQLLHQGNGRFWSWDQHHGRLWLYSVAKVGISLNCSKLTGSPVYLPVQAMTQGIGAFKAHLYTAWHSGRVSQNPISRQTLQSITAVPERTQRFYEKQTKIKVKQNLAIGDTYSPENIEQQSWQRGGALFKFVDKNGRFGPKQKTYLAWQLPNSYVGPHEQAAHGRQRQINHQLTDLVHKGAQGNGELPIKKTFFDHGKDAVHSSQKQDLLGHTTYWPAGKCTSYSLWHLFFYS